MAQSAIAPAAAEATDDAQSATAEPTLDQLLVEEDLVIEEVSIDGMCGVY